MNVDPAAPGRLSGAPVAIVDIGSNSVRLVAYESLSRALTPIFNEKVLCGLGKGVATTGLLAPDAMDKAIAALQVFRLRCVQMQIDDVTVLATAATREASNGAAFLVRAREAIGADIALVGGAREAELSALGVLSGTHRPDGIVGDLGGGSLELIDIMDGRIGQGCSLPIGGLALSDLSKESPKRAVRIVREALAGAALLADLKGRTFYAVGGTWRALAKLHMSRRNYPLHVAQGYALPVDDPSLFADLIDRSDRDAAPSLAPVPAARRPLLGYGAVIMEEIVRIGQPAAIIVSTSGVREGLLYERLDTRTRASDPLLLAASEFNMLRSRSPGHGEDLRAWTDAFFASLGLAETDDERRLRHAACLLSDIAWRAHPDYRGAQAFANIANAAFVGIDHPGRCFLALTISLRHDGIDTEAAADVRSLVTPALLERARIIAGALRIAFQVSAAVAGVLPEVPLEAGAPKLSLRVPARLAELTNARILGRLRQLAKLVGREPEIIVAR